MAFARGACASNRRDACSTSLFTSLVLIVGLMMLGAAPPLAPTTQPEKKPKVPTEKITIVEEVFKLELAADPESRERGLMKRKEIKDHSGMLFIYPETKTLSFWMKNCIVDIDLIFLDHRGRIVRLHPMKAERQQGKDEGQLVYEKRLKRYRSVRPARFAIELKAGSIKRLKLNRGDLIEMETDRLLKLAK